LFIQDILDAIQKAEEFVGTMSYEDFLADDKTKSAVVRELEIIGETTKHVPSHIRKRYPHIPWSSMAKMRDRLAHGYWTVDYEIVLVEGRYYFSGRPNLNRVLLDKQEAIAEEAVSEEIQRGVQAAAGEALFVYPGPETSRDIPDNRVLKLVLLSERHRGDLAASDLTALRGGAAAG